MINSIKAFKWHFLYLFLLCTVGPLSFNWGPVPFSFQTLFILTSPFIFKRKEAVALILIYLFLGVIGLPVFAGYTGGIEKLYGPTSGFLWGFVPVVYILGMLMESESFLRLFYLLILGHFLLFIPGFIVLKYQKPDIELFTIFIRFIPGIFIKSGMGAIVVMSYKNFIEKNSA